MENILTNSGLIHICEQIFGYFDQKTLKNCREAFAQKYGEDWDLWLERLILVQCIFEFGDKEILLAEQTKWRYGRLLSRAILRDFVPGWDKAVKKFGKMASLNDLNEVKGSLKGLLEDRSIMSDKPLHYAAWKGHVKLMELLLNTDLNINEADKLCGSQPFILACQKGHIEIVNLMVTVSKEYGIDLNARQYYEMTGFISACLRGRTEIVNFIITASKEYDIDLNAGDADGFTGFISACNGGHTKIAELMIDNRTKYGIDIQQKDYDGQTALDLVNIRIKKPPNCPDWLFRESSEEKKASFKELKRILEKAYLEDNDIQPTAKKFRTQ